MESAIQLEKRQEKLLNIYSPIRFSLFLLRAYSLLDSFLWLHKSYGSWFMSVWMGTFNKKISSLYSFVSSNSLSSLLFILKTPKFSNLSNSFDQLPTVFKLKLLLPQHGISDYKVQVHLLWYSMLAQYSWPIIFLPI